MSNQPLPLCKVASSADSLAADLTFEMVGDRVVEFAIDDEVPVYPTPDRRDRALFRSARLPDGTLNMTLDGRKIGIEEYFQFLISPDGSHISVAWSSTTPLSHVLPYLLNPGLGAALRLRGALGLHASAIQCDGHAIVVIGPKGAGKSTLTNSMIDAGYRLIADDLCAIALDSASAHVHSLYPRLRLTPQTVKNLYGSVDALPEIWPGRTYPLNKRYRPLEHDQFCEGATPVCALIVLEPRLAKHAQIRLEKLSRVEAMLNLLRNTFVQYALDRQGRETEMNQLKRLVSLTPSFTVGFPDSLELLTHQSKLLPEMVLKQMKNHATV